MKEYKYTIDGKEYKVEIGEIVENIADVTVNGESFKVELEPEKEPEKKKVVLGKPTDAPESDEQTTSAANVNTANDKPLPVGAVCSAEPGIYLPGKFGVRIEDVTILSENGCEVITQSPKQLIVV